VSDTFLVEWVKLQAGFQDGAASPLPWLPLKIEPSEAVLRLLRLSPKLLIIGRFRHVAALGADGGGD
tara:strand:- start:6974 stop:7174 length:201 start_codon:yes stop_codon:yes gene_type:complete